MQAKSLSEHFADFLVYFGVVFLPAGRLDWLPGWAFLALFFGGVLARDQIISEKHPDLMNERRQPPAQGRAGWDRVLLPTMQAALLVWIALSVLDAARFGWSAVPFWVQSVGGGMLVLGQIIIYLAFRENPFLSNVVRIQKDREQRVVESGVYAQVRHPMYAGLALTYPGGALLMGSWLGFGFALLMNAGLVLRTMLEERFLTEKLEGYAGYLSRVRHRLIPRIW